MNWIYMYYISSNIGVVVPGVGGVEGARPAVVSGPPPYHHQDPPVAAVPLQTWYFEHITIAFLFKTAENELTNTNNKMYANMLNKQYR